MRLSFILFPLAVAVAGAWEDTTHCVYFCKTSRGEFFCCGRGDSGARRPEVHSGRCPAVRPECPNTSTREIPRSCAHDGQCDRRSKCCYDVCLKWTVCKPAQRRGNIFQDIEHDIGGFLRTGSGQK